MIFKVDLSYLPDLDVFGCKKRNQELKEMAQWSSALTVLPEDMSSITASTRQFALT